VEIFISGGDVGLRPANLQVALAEELGPNSGVVLTIRRSEIQFRGIDSTILVASVTAIGTALGAIIGGLLRIAQEAKTRKVVIQGRRGQRLEIPADTDPHELDRWIDCVKRLDSEDLKISFD
jgi:hypothetical protein